MAEDSTPKSPRSSSSRSRGRTTKTPRQTSSTPAEVVESTPTAAPAPSRSQTRKAVTPVPKVTKTWAEKLEAKNRKIDKLLNSTSLGFGRLSIGTVLDIKKRVRNKGPSAVTRMHFLGSPRQRKKLAAVIESILDS